MPKSCRTALSICLVLLALLALAACKPSSEQAKAAADPAAKPAQAIRLLTDHLRDNDLEAFSRDAVPPALYTQLEAAWRSGHTRWPLDELPFGKRVPDVLKAFSEPGAPAHLQTVYGQQFAHQDRQIHAAARSLGLFGAQTLQQQGDYSDDERQHYAQLVTAVSAWGAQAPLGDPKRARMAITRLSAAAVETGLTSPAAFTDAGMGASLRKLGPFVAVFKQVLAQYGWKLDADLAGMEATLQQQTGDSAQVRMRYTLAGQPIDTVVTMQRVDGRWYVADYLRHARAAVASAAAQPAAAQPAAAQPSATPGKPGP